MATNYPAGYDEYGVPSLPEQTPLSSAGDSTRNHTELLRDIGDATEALERHASQKGHDHSGDAADPTKGGKLAQANTHESADTDLAGGIHHTVGEGHEQAARGDHVHDYNDATRLLNRPYVICTSTARPPMPDVGLQIYEKDTKRVRIWDTFGNTEAVEGLNTIENYNSGASNSLPGAVWAVTYDVPDLMHGQLGTPNGTHLSWIDGGNAYQRAIARRIKAEDKTTQTDDQVMTWKNGPTQIEQVLWFTSPASNDKYFRMSDDGQSYWRVMFGYDYVFVFYTTTGRTGEKELGRSQVFANFANNEYRAELKDRTLSLYWQGELLMAVVDRDAVTNKGAQFRGWGVGQSAGQRGFGQTSPGSEDWVRMQDSRYYVANNRWTILPVAKIPVVRLRQNSTQQLNASGSIVEWGDELEDEFDYFNKTTSPTDIVVKEPGLYDIKAAIQWDPSLVPDTATAVLCINGIETTIRKQQFMRGGGFTPGFSQTLDLTGQLRFNTNDVLTVKVKYVASGGLLGLIFSWFDQASKINSRLDMNYIRV